MTAIPVADALESVNLVGEDYAQLFEIILTGNQGTLRFWDGPERVYQGFTYEALGCALQGEEKSATEKQSRPTLGVLNPGNIFAPYILEGFLDGATVIRKRVRKHHLVNDINIFHRRVWLVARVSDLDLAGQKVLIELRDPSDGPNFLIPARMYLPPDFPTVNLR